MEFIKNCQKNQFFFFFLVLKKKKKKKKKKILKTSPKLVALAID